MTPDFRIPGEENREDGLQPGAEEEDAEEPEETAGVEPKQDERSSGYPDVPREAVDPLEKERSKDTRRDRHVPGGAWLTKKRYFFIENQDIITKEADMDNGDGEVERG
ncbi:hypothetical protein NDU88_002567 [Pleurodeles waltl]|uniref:Uncharacterized protein n=1 Tax=Pleurodeles waltl TaxID=8319 RepID=A0AAV7RDS0_PLEWA|nr:hypothetical protein NDU88_002567 [Pleurodeles waltl]